MKVTVEKERALIGERVSVSFQRTLRIPEDHQSYPLPPSLGFFALHKIEDYAESVPDSWRASGGCFIAMHQREALWIGLNGAEWKPNAIKIAVGRINAISGARAKDGLHSDPQDYIVCPTQPWLDGVNAGNGFIRQFVAAPLGSGQTIEGQITGTEDFGGIQITVYEPKPGVFPEAPPPEPEMMETLYDQELIYGEEMGLGVGGRVKQKIYPDDYGIEIWDQQNYESLSVHILNSEQYKEITGQKSPPPPISVETYVKYGLPWFDYYDEKRADLLPSPALAALKTIGHKNHESGNSPHPEEQPVRADQLRVWEIGRTRPDDEE
jgi:hypothetical protein